MDSAPSSLRPFGAAEPSPATGDKGQRQQDTSCDDEMHLLTDRIDFGELPKSSARITRVEPAAKPFVFPSFPQDMTSQDLQAASRRLEERSVWPEGPAAVNGSAKENRSPKAEEEGWQYQGDERPKHQRMNTFSSGGSSPSDIFSFSPPLAESFSTESKAPTHASMDHRRHRSSSSSIYADGPPAASTFHSPSSSISSLSRASRQIPSSIDIFTSPVYSEATHGRSRQHSLDQVPSPSSARPSFHRRGSSSSSRGSFAAPYNYGRSTSSSSSSRGSSAPSSRRGSLAGLFPLSPHHAEIPLQPPLDPSTPPRSPARSRRGSIALPSLPPTWESAQPIDIPPLPDHSPVERDGSLFIRRRPSTPGLATLWDATPSYRASSSRASSASTSPVNERFTFSTAQTQKGPSCSMFDPPLVRSFGRHAVSAEEAEQGRRRESDDEEVRQNEWDQMGGNEQAEDALTQAVRQLGLGLALGEEKVDDDSQAMDDEEKVYPPELDAELLSETVGFLDSRNKLARGQKSVLILSPKRLLRTAYHLISCPPVQALLLGEWWSEVSRQPPTSSISPNPAGSAPPHVKISIRGVPVHTSNESALGQWMQEDGVLVDRGGPQTRVIAGRFFGLVALPSTSQSQDTPSPETVVTVSDSPLNNGDKKTVRTFLGPTLQSGSTEEEYIHHGDLLAIKCRMGPSPAVDTFFALSSTASFFPTSDWRAATCGGRRPYRVASADFTVSSDGWDAFLIYAVDPSAELGRTTKQPAFKPGYPSPPVNALTFEPLFPSRIHYNQPIVLQSMATGQFSPLLALRQVAGLSAPSSSPAFLSLLETALLPHLEDEQLGPPVTSHAPLAFELIDGSRATQCFFDPSQSPLNGPIRLADSATWSLTPIDIARHTFYIPRTMQSSPSPDCALPAIFEYDPPSPTEPNITLYGANFTESGLTIWVSLHRTPYYIFKSPEIILVPPPPYATPPSVVAGGVRGRRLAIGLQSGVVVMTNVLYRE